MCLGVKDSAYYFNEPEDALPEVNKNDDNNVHFEEASYELVHNIIYAAVEFAEEYGIAPCEEFTDITQYFLEEDTADIPFIDIQCGDEDGKPLYVNTGFDTPAREKQILAILEKTAGHGNYNYMLKADGVHYGNDDDNVNYKYYEEDESEEDESEEDESEEDEYVEYEDKSDSDGNDDLQAIEKELKKIKDTIYSQSLEELKIMLLQQLKQPDNDKVFFITLSVADAIVDKIIDEDKVAEYIEILKKDIDVPVVDGFDLPNSFFKGLQNGNREDIVDTYREIHALFDENRHGKALKKLRKAWGDIPLAYYMELKFINMTEKKREKKIDEYCRKYPDYFLFKLLKCAHYGRTDDLKTLLLNTTEPVTDRELAEFLFHYGNSLENDVPEKIIAFEKIVDRYVNDFYVPALSAMMLIPLLKLRIAKDYCGLKNPPGNE
jgi:hypothetical protein